MYSVEAVEKDWCLFEFNKVHITKWDSLFQNYKLAEGTLGKEFLFKLPLLIYTCCCAYLLYSVLLAQLCVRKIHWFHRNEFCRFRVKESFIRVSVWVNAYASFLVQVSLLLYILQCRQKVLLVSGCETLILRPSFSSSLVCFSLVAASEKKCICEKTSS